MGDYYGKRGEVVSFTGELTSLPTVLIEVYGLKGRLSTFSKFVLAKWSDLFDGSSLNEMSRISSGQILPISTTLCFLKFLPL